MPADTCFYAIYVMGPETYCAQFVSRKVLSVTVNVWFKFNFHLNKAIKQKRYPVHKYLWSEFPDSYCLQTDKVKNSYFSYWNVYIVYFQMTYFSVIVYRRIPQLIILLIYPVQNIFFFKLGPLEWTDSVCSSLHNLSK